MKYSIRAILVLGVVCLFAGCGGYGGVAPVSGTVTLDGQPLPDALVRFQPLEGGRPSTATTNAQGEYTLRYTQKQEGAERGKHRVFITTAETVEDEQGNEVLTEEKVPARYNTENDDHIVEVDGSPIDLKLTTTPAQ